MSHSPGAPHVDDQRAVGRILDGEPQAWNQFVDRYSDRVWRRSWQLCSEACPYGRGRGGVFCVFHALAQNGVQPRTDDRPSCDDGLEIYAFIFEYLYNREQKTGKLKHYDGRAGLDTFVAAVLHGHLRTDWIRHHRKLRVDQITHPPEIQRLKPNDRKVFEQMVMQRPTETIARELSMEMAAVEQAQERVTHALMANGNLHLVLRSPERNVPDEELPRAAGGRHSIHLLPLQRHVEHLWVLLCDMIGALPPSERILLEMAFDEELDAKTMLERCERFSLDLPVVPRTGQKTIHTVYQSIDAVLRKLGRRLKEDHSDVLEEARTWLGDGDAPDDAPLSISVKGLKTLLKHMGLRLQPDDDAAAPGAAPSAAAG